ncbi:MAG: hypothetical protein R6V05_08320 [Candidatus Brocadiia bacterium]
MDNLITVHRQPYRALSPCVACRPVIALDLGYSAKRPSCGLACTGDKDGEAHVFGEAVRKTATRLDEDRFGNAVLVLEAPLSMCHGPKGNPQLRGPFERGRGWYYGAGALTLIAARRFLWELARLLPEGKEVALAEAFLSNKPAPVPHPIDAEKIAGKFWDSEVKTLRVGCEPTSLLVAGVPPVKVFCH